MGGLGSGACRSTTVGDVEDALKLDIRALRRLGVIRTGECVCDTINWSIGGLSTLSALIRVDLSDIKRGGEFKITSNVRGTIIRQPIAIDAVPSPFGGWRCYFICPITARRCEVLYYARGRFASREAQRLSYAVQNISKISRARRKSAKLCRRLRGAGTPRPRGANRIKIAQRLHEAERDAQDLHLDLLRTLAEESGSRRIPD